MTQKGTSRASASRFEPPSRPAYSPASSNRRARRRSMRTESVPRSRPSRRASPRSRRCRRGRGAPRRRRRRRRRGAAGARATRRVAASDADKRGHRRAQLRSARVAHREPVPRCERRRRRSGHPAASRRRARHCVRTRGIDARTPERASRRRSRRRDRSCRTPACDARFQVVSGHTRRVEPRICVEPGETASEITGHSRRIRSAHVSVGAGKTARAARPTLVDHDEIAVSLYPREEVIHPDRSRRRRATRPALEIEQRTRGGPLRRRQHRDSQGDHRAVRLTRILRNAQSCAPPVDVAAVGARGKMRLTARRPPRPGTPDKPEHKAAERDDGGDREQRPDPTRQATARRPPRFAPTTQQRIVRAVTHRSRNQPSRYLRWRARAKDTRSGVSAGARAGT